VNRIEDALPTVLGELADGAPHDSDLADRVRSRSRRRRMLTAGPIAAVLAVTAVVGAVWLGRPAAPDGTPNVGGDAPSACRPLDTGPLPVWARAGFSNPTGNPFTMGTKGDIAAVVFAAPLRAPAAPDTSNKILWVARETPAPGDRLVITGTLEGSTLRHTVALDTAPGPSGVDMPQPGCWHLELRWGTNTDSVDLRWEGS
jgi:hypothetical protein